MSSVRFYYNNLVSLDTTVITPSTEEAFFPASHLKLDQTTKTFRTTAASGNVVFDFVTTEPANALLIKGRHDLGFGFDGGSVTFEANPTDVWTSPAFTQVVSVNELFNLGVVNLSSSQSYRFWRVSGSGATFLELANIYIGQSYIPQRNVSVNFNYKNDDLSKYRENNYGQRYVDVRTQRKNIRLKINLLDQDGLDDFLAFTNNVGKKKPFWMVMDDTEFFSNDKERFAGMFYFKSVPTMNHAIKGLYGTNMDIVECN